MIGESNTNDEGEDGAPELEQSDRSEDPSQTSKRKKLKAVVVNVDELVESESRDAAERALTASEKSMRGISGFFKKIWKHTTFREFYRQKYLKEARAAIKNTGDIYAAEKSQTIQQNAHEAAMAAVAERFSHEYDETLHKGESRRKVGDTLKDQRFNSAVEVKAEIRDLIGRYAGGAITDAEFAEAKKRAFRKLAGSEEHTKAESMYADNLLELAKQVRQSIAHGERLEDLDIDLELVVGRARDNVGTEANYNTVDRAIEWAKKSPAGLLLNESIIANAISISVGVTVGLSRKVASSRLAAVATIGGSAALGAGLIGYAENKRMKEDRRQHAREMAQGRSFDRGVSPRRAEMDNYIHVMKGAGELTNGLRVLLSAERLATPEGLKKALSQLADIEARIQLGDREKIDLISYSDPTKVARERLQLDIARAEAKIAMRRLLSGDQLPAGKTADEFLSDLVSLQTESLTNGDQGIDARNRMFNQMKRKLVAYAAGKGLLAGVVLGSAFQEGAAFLNENQTGILEHAATGKEGDHVTWAESIREWIFGRAPTGPVAMHEALVGNTHFTLPENFSVQEDGNGTITLLEGDKPIAKHIPLLPDGTLSQGAVEMLGTHGIIGTSNIDHIDTTTKTLTPTAAYLAKHPDLGHRIARDGWYDNDTPKPKFDLNELKLWWGGDRSTPGINKDGHIVLDVSHMTAGGSFHGGLSANAQELAKDGKLTLLFSLSKDTQGQPISVPINAEGNVVIDPNSEVGKLLFSQDGGKARFLGRFAEVAQVTGTKDGIDHVRILATLEGKGVDSVPETIPGVKDEPHVHIAPPLPHDTVIDPPPILPIYWRKPLEPESKRNPIAQDPTKEFLAKAPVAPFSYYGYGGGFETMETLLKGMKEKNVEFDPYYVQKGEGGKKSFTDKEGNPIHRDVERERNHIQAYLASQDESYVAGLKVFAETIEPMHESCRVSVIVPARLEENNLANFLTQYVKQTDGNGRPINADLFEINIIVNRKQGEPADKSMEVIAEWKRQNPGYHINAIDVVFPPTMANVGNARKHITDLALLRSLARNSAAGPLYIESEDADITAVDRRTIWKIAKDFDEKPHLDILKGIEDRQPEILQQNDLLFFQRRLSDTAERFMRNDKYRPENTPGGSFFWNRIISGGWNNAFTAEAYAQIGGYVPDKMGEDMKIGWKISLLRGHEGTDEKYIPNTRTVGVSGLRSNSSPRRFLDTMIKQINPYDDFEDQSLKSKAIDDLLADLEHVSKANEETRPKYQDAIDGMWLFLRGNAPLEAAPLIFAKTLRAMGLKKINSKGAGDYVLTEDGFAKLTDEGMQTIIATLEKYRKEKRYLWGYRRQNSPFSTAEPLSDEKAIKNTESK